MEYILLLVITVLITLLSQSYISITYSKTNQIKSNSGMTGYDTARKILDSNGLTKVKINEVSGNLTDHYDPRSKTVNLSTEVYRKSSLAAISVAAHECGHAIQDKNNYAFLRFRESIIPLVNFASRIGYIVIIISIFASLLKLLWIGIILECVILLFQIVTLPVEFNASSRALKQIVELNIVSHTENKSCKKMLRAAALTYVAGVAAAVLEILRLVLIATSDR